MNISISELPHNRLPEFRNSRFKNTTASIQPEEKQKVEDSFSSSVSADKPGGYPVGIIDFKKAVAASYKVAKPGTKKWDFETGDLVESSPCVGPDGTVYVGSWNGKLHAIDKDGKKKWDFKTGGDIKSSPCAGPDGNIYVRSGDGKLYAIGKDGKKKWDFKTGDNMKFSPCVGPDGTVYVGSWNGKLHAIDKDGKKKWDFKTSCEIESSPCIGPNGTVYVGSSDKNLYAIQTVESLTDELKTIETEAESESSKTIVIDEKEKKVIIGGITLERCG